MPIQAPKQVLELLAKLRASGHVAHCVGGCVRDLLLGREPKDWDIATSARPEQILKIFPDALTLGARFAVIAVKTPLGPVEIASFREDGDYLDARRPSEIRYSDAAGDARRRDFTVNALFWDAPDEKAILDYAGGLADLRARLLRCVGRAEERFTEDRLRLLRAVRFAWTLQFTIETETAAALRKLGPSLDPRRPDASVSAERVAAEFEKLFARGPAGQAFASLYPFKLEEILFPEVAWSTELLQRLGRAPRPLQVWALLAASAPPGLVERLKLPRASVAGLRSCAELAPRLRALAQADIGLARETLLNPFTDEALELLRLQDGPDFEATSAFVQREQKFLREHPEAAEPLLDGAALKKMGFLPGRAMGELLAQLRRERLAGRVNNADEARLFAEKQRRAAGA